MITPDSFPDIDEFIIATNVVKLSKYTKHVLLEEGEDKYYRPEQINIGSRVIMTHAERQEMRSDEDTLEKIRQALRSVREFNASCDWGTWDPDECGVDVGEVE